MGKSYFLVPDRPNFDYPPDGPIAIGNILDDPFDPANPLNGASRTPPAPELLAKSHKTDWQATITDSTSGRLSLWATFLQNVLGVGGGVGGHFKNARTEVYKFDRMETQLLDTSKDYRRYLEQTVLGDPSVLAYLRASRISRNSIYMITGVKIVRGAQVKDTIERGFGGDGEVSVDATMLTGVPVSTTPKLEASRDKKQEISFSGSSDFVFAYRLRKIRYREGQGLRQDEYVDGALLGRDDEEQPESEVALPPFVIDMEEDDIGIREGSHIDAVVDDDDEECICVLG